MAVPSRAKPHGHDEWLKVPAEAAAYAKCSQSTIKRASSAGKLPTIGRGRLRRTRKSWVDAWLAGLGVVLAVLLVVVLLCVLVAPVRHWCHEQVVPFVGASEQLDVTRGTRSR